MDFLAVQYISRTRTTIGHFFNLFMLFLDLFFSKKVSLFKKYLNNVLCSRIYRKLKSFQNSVNNRVLVLYIKEFVLFSEDHNAAKIYLGPAAWPAILARDLIYCGLWLVKGLFGRLAIGQISNGRYWTDCDWSKV